MKRLYRVLGLGAIALAVATPALLSTPVMAQLQQVTQTVAQTLQREPQVQLNLSVQKQVTTMDAKGQPVISWQNLGNQAVAHPGDVLRFSVEGQNSSDRAVRNLVVTQPISTQMTYVLDSATVNQASGTEITYSIDQGQTFVAQPTIDVKQPDGSVITRPAPAEQYTHIRWNFGNAVSAGTIVNATYQATIQ